MKISCVGSLEKGTQGDRCTMRTGVTVILTVFSLTLVRMCDGKQVFPLYYYPAKLAIIKNEYYCTTFIDSVFFFPFFLP